MAHDHDGDLRFRAVYERAHALGLAAENDAEERVKDDPEVGGPWVSARLVLLPDEDGFVAWLRRQGLCTKRSGGGAVVSRRINREAVSWAYLNAFDRGLEEIGVRTVAEGDPD